MALLKLNLRESLRYNPIILLMLVSLLGIVFLETYKLVTKEVETYYKLRLIINYLLLISIIGILIVRNWLLVFCGIDLVGDFKT